MKSESDDIHELVEALREDLPSERDAARIRARLAGFGVALGAGLTGSEALAALAGTKAAASAGTVGLWSQLGALSWGAKLGVAAAVSVSAITGPLIVAKMESKPAPAVAAREPAQKRSVNPGANARGPAANAPSLEMKGPTPDGAPVLDSPPIPPPVLDTPGRDVVRPQAAAPERLDRIASGAARPSAPRQPLLEAESTRVAKIATPASTATESMPVANTAPVSVEPSATAATELSAPAAATSLAEETRLIDAAFSALRARDRAAAERFVREHELRFPDGILRRERERARAALFDRR